MAERRRGLGRGIAALIPPSQKEQKDSPIDVFFGATPNSGAEAAGEVAIERDADAAVTDDAVPAGAEPDSAAAKKADTEKNRRNPTTSASTRAKGASSKTSTKASAKASAKASTKASTKESSASSDETSLAAQDTTSHTPATGVIARDGVAPDTDSKDTGVEEAVVQATVSGETSVEDAVAEDAVVQDLATPAGAPEAAESDDADGLVAVPGASYAELPLNQVVPNQKQPRSVFDEDDLNELAASIKEVGVLQPIIVRPLSAPLENAPEARYELIMGERRLRASQIAGNDSIPAIVRRTLDEDLLRDALLENLHRAQLNALEEAAAYQQLLDDFQCTQEELSRRIARSRPQISNTLRLLKLPPLVQRRVAAGVLSAGHARALLGLSDPGAMERLAQRIVAEGLSVRQVEEIVALGDEPAAIPVGTPRRRAKRYAFELGELSGRLADRFDTRVKVEMGAHKGSIKIDFASIEDLNRILTVLTPGEDGVDVAD